MNECQETKPLRASETLGVIKYKSSKTGVSDSETNQIKNGTEE